MPLGKQVPDVRATAVPLQPGVAEAVWQADSRMEHALRCACDVGLSTFLTGSALGAMRHDVQQLHRKKERRYTLSRTWHLDRISVHPPNTAEAQTSTVQTEAVYRNLIPQQKIKRRLQSRYTLRRLKGTWKVESMQVVRRAVHAQRLPAAPPLSAQAVFVLDDTSARPLYGYNADAERFVASTAKMLTAIVALKRLGLDSVVTVPSDAMLPGTSANLGVGERIRVRDLFYAMLLPSGNDAAETLADATAGSAPAFAQLMNRQARRLRLTHSHFVAPHGLDYVGQHSSARDLARIGHALLRHRFLAGVVHTRWYRAVSADHVYVHVWTNLNKLLWSYPGVIGIKTGTTPAAGANLVAASVRGNRRIIAVVLGDTTSSRFPDATRLLDYAWRLEVALRG